MCEQTENNYLDGDIVWVKLGSCWWPGEVVGPEKLPPDLLPSFRKPPIAVVKFFQEDTYEYVKNLNSIYHYNCSRKNEFINKGLYMYRTKHGPMEKFPEDVIRAETAVGGDIKILTRDEFQETKKESYAGLFGDPKKTPSTSKKGKAGGKGRPQDESRLASLKKLGEKSDYKVHILLQGSKTPNQTADSVSTPSTSRAGSEPSEVIEKPTETKCEETETPQPTKEQLPTMFSTPTMSSSGLYSCHACQFTTTRLNVLILHNKTHSITYSPYTPSLVRKKLIHKTTKSTPVTSKVAKPRKLQQERTDKTPKKPKSNKRVAEPGSVHELKKPKTDEEIKSSLLADWDDGDEESNDESTTMIMAGSPEVPIAAESPAVPTPAELPIAQVPVEIQSPSAIKSDDSNLTEKPESSCDSKYEFCEDEDWPIEADIGRKIPRVKNPSKRKSETKSVSIDEDDMAREVAELLNKTTLPELPSAPEPLKVEENFPQASIVKSPDKTPNNSRDQSSPEKKNLSDTPHAPKTIFKTKTFFRSRHSRSQDAIGKYVAEQLNAAERMDLTDNEINGVAVNVATEIRASPPVEHMKVARLAPKIQLKKMKAEAAQLREREKYNAEKLKDDYTLNVYSSKTEKPLFTESLLPDSIEEKENSTKSSGNEITHEIICNKKYERNNKDNINNDPDKQAHTKKENEETINNEIKTNEITPLHDHVKDGIHREVKDPITENNSKSYEPFMNESTASAVDALLSVSRETDRVTRVISDDPPEDLFEEDVKDTSNSVNLNGLNDIVCKRDELVVKKDTEILDSKTEEETNLKSENQNIETKEDKLAVDVETKQDNNDVKNVGLVDVNVSAVIQEEDKINETSIKETMKEKLPSNEIDSAECKVNELSESFSAENIPSESDLQIAEALINLPTTTMQTKVAISLQEKNTAKEVPVDFNQSSFLEENKSTEDKITDTASVQSEIPVKSKSDNINSRFETEQEMSENLNAAESLVQMSETIDHKIKIPEVDQPNKEIVSVLKSREDDIKLDASENDHKISLSDNKNEPALHHKPEFETNSSKLLKILEEPCLPKISPVKKTITKQIIMPGKEKILNFEAGKPTLKPKSQSPKQKIIIRRTAPAKNLLNNIGEVTTPDKIILSRSNKPTQDGSSVPTYTIQTTPESKVTGDNNTIIIQQKIRKITKPLSKLQKLKPQPQSSLISSVPETKTMPDTKKEEAIFDINSMPVVLSDDILTPESIEKMPIVMSDGNITLTNNPPKLVKTKPSLIENERVAISQMQNKTEMKTLLLNPSNEVSKVTTPNILSKSAKFRGAKPMLVIDKVTGKQKIIMTKSEPAVKEVKQPHQTLVQSVPQNSAKTEKFIILPTPSSPRQGKTQKIVIDPQTGKAHVYVGKASEPPLSVSDTKPVSAKLIPSASDTSTPGNTVMIITNAQGAQSRIVLTPEHEKILFPNKQQNISQLKNVSHRLTSNTTTTHKNVISSAAPTKTQTRIVPKQKSAIITSKGQLIVGGRITTTAQNIAPLPEIRPAPKRILAAEPKKLVQTIQKNSSEPLIFLQQKSGAVMQLTAAQFEHLQRTGQIIQKAPAQEKIIVQKSITIPPNETVVSNVPKPRIRKQMSDSPTPSKKVKHEIVIAPAPSPVTSIPALTPLSNTFSPPQLTTNVSSTLNNVTATNYSDLDNIEELLPSTAIARRDSGPIQPEIAAVPPPAPLSDGQLLAVPGENFGGPPGSFYLCVEENGTFTVIDNRPLVLENNQLVPMAEPLPVLTPQPERRDILEAALANSDVFHAETARDDAPDFRDLNANVSVHCRVSETSTTLNQPIMTPVEVPTKVDSEPAVPSTLEDGLAVIGVTPHTVPTSLELPITVTDPRIAPKTTDPLRNNNYGTSLLTSPNTEITFTTSEETDMPVVGPISMPLLTEEESVGKSMPILTDEVTDRTVSSVESTVGSPSSIDVRESENEDSSQWPRRLLTPCSDTSETSAEIPLQPVMQLSVSDLAHSS